MSKYKLIGDYSIHNVSAEKKNDAVTARIPFTRENGTMQHGLDTVLRTLNNNEISPSEDGFDILTLAALVYLADTRISRIRHAEDSWTREISLELPVFNLDKWASLEKLFAQMLNFLTGDRWKITFTKRKNTLSENNEHKKIYDVVSLFSGGMDSLIGTVNHLEQNHSVAMISHAGDGYTKDAQKSLFAMFTEKYPEITKDYYSLYMSFGKDYLLDGGKETSTRSRSFLFIAFGIFAISGMDKATVLQVPENGLISLNVPLDTLRVGSHSTRTTHPFYMDLWNKALSELGLFYSVSNPYWNKTKGEMAEECLNKDLILKAIGKSTSCSSPAKLRWEKLPSMHCGYCVPCIIRRAAIHKAYGFDNDTSKYARSSVRELVEAHAKSKGIQLRSFQVAIKRIKDNPNLKHTLIYKSGNLDSNIEYINQLADVYYRGLLEVDEFISSYLQSEDNKTK